MAQPALGTEKPGEGTPSFGDPTGGAENNSPPQGSEPGVLRAALEWSQECSYFEKLLTCSTEKEEEDGRSNRVPWKHCGIPEESLVQKKPAPWTQMAPGRRLLPFLQLSRTSDSRALPHSRVCVAPNHVKTDVRQDREGWASV